MLMSVMVMAKKTAQPQAEGDEERAHRREHKPKEPVYGPSEFLLHDAIPPYPVYQDIPCRPGNTGPVPTDSGDYFSL